MTDSPRASHIIRFGVFELDVAAGELRREGLRVKLQNQPVRVLALLLKRSGEVVPRDDFRQEIWPADTFVDFDRGLSTAINKIREALGDSADNPRFVETVPRRGYRFIAPVEGRKGPAEASSETVGTFAASTSGPEPAGRQSEARPQVAEPRFNRRAWLWGVAVGVAFLLGFLGRGLLLDRDDLQDKNLMVRRFQIPLEDPRGGGRLDRTAISPDGTMVVYIDKGRLWVRDLNRLESRDVPDTEGAYYPFWSPDSRFIGFVAGGLLRKVPVAGGPITTLCELPTGVFSGATWGGIGSVVFAIVPKGLFEVSSRGGDPALKLRADPGKGEMPHTPHFLPDGRTLLFVMGLAGSGPAWKIVAVSESASKDVYETKARTPFVPNTLAYSPSGHLLYSRGGSSIEFWAVGFSLSSLAVSGEPFRVQNGKNPSCSSDGTLVYQSLWYVGRAPHQLVWVDRSGKVLRTIGQRQDRMRRPALSPDGGRVAVTGNEQGNDDIWIHDIARGTKKRLTFHPDVDASPAWSPSGDRIAFDSTRSGLRDIFVKAADGGGEAQPLVTGPLWQAVPEWSRDGKHLLYATRGAGTNLDQWRRLLSGEADPAPFLQTSHVEAQASLSPDVRYAVYQSNESGRFEIYVTAFPTGEEKLLVSTNGGVTPKWSPRGDELFYVEGNSLMAVSIETRRGLRAGTTQKLFDGEQVNMQFSPLAPMYDVAADGQHFVVVQGLGRDIGNSVIVVENWFAEFDK